LWKKNRDALTELAMLRKVENEDLVMTLEVIVEKFGDEIAPYAVGLCQNLNVAFWKLTEDEVREHV
jgi:hypothetical protein